MRETLSVFALLCLIAGLLCISCTPRNSSESSRAAVTMKIDLRAQPSFDSQVLCTLSPGDAVTLLDSLNQHGTLWYLVQTSDCAAGQCRRGWILADALVALDKPLKCFSCGV